MISFIENDQIGFEGKSNFYIHTNTVITSKTDVTDYYTNIHKHINNFYENEYFVKDNYDIVLIEFIGFLPKSDTNKLVPFKSSSLKSNNPFIHIKISYSTSATTENKKELEKLKRNSITPLIKSGWNERITLCALDVETCKVFGDLQYPSAISFAYYHYSVKSFVHHNKLKINN